MHSFDEFRTVPGDCRPLDEAYPATDPLKMAAIVLRSPLPLITHAKHTLLVTKITELVVCHMYEHTCLWGCTG